MKTCIQFAFLTLIFFQIACKRAENTDISLEATKETFPEIEKAKWLIGTWENDSETGKLIEIWSRENDSAFQGESYFIKGKDTLHSETILLEQMGKNLIYSPTVKGQNNDKAIPFRMTSSTEKQLIFENSEHDYPQKIIYNQITDDSLVAEISGLQHGKRSSETLSMKKLY